MSDDEENFNTIQHQKLLAEINDIVNTQHIKKPSRNEPAVHKNEFNLVKKTIGNGCTLSGKNRVSIGRLTETIRNNTKQKQIAKQLLNAFKNENTLSKPLEKIHSERIQRTIAYDNTKTNLSRWDAVVERNKVADQLVFPLNTDKVDIVNQKRSYSNYRVKSDLMKSLEVFEAERNPEKTLHKESDSEDDGTLTVEEMRARRKELAKIRTREGFKISKARLQSKIKSKTYHKLKKREKVKQNMKDFEALKATDPEAALKELNKIEKQRMEERAGLRHKNTGTWAKNLQVRAKYDMNVKQDLEEQLALSRELTQKQQVNDSSESEDEELCSTKPNANPWLSEGTENKDEINNVFSGYKKLWEVHNTNKRALAAFNKKKASVIQPNCVLKDDTLSHQKNNVPKAVPTNLGSKWVEEDIGQSGEETHYSEDDDNQSSFINDLFDKAEQRMITAVDSKYKKLGTQLDDSKNKKMKLEKTKEKKRFNIKEPGYLEFKKQPKLTDIDDGIIEGENSENTEDLLNRNLGQNLKPKQNGISTSGVKDINPDSFLAVKSKHLITALPEEEFDEMYNEGSEKLRNMNKMSLAEAFEDDDIMDFIEEEDDISDNKKMSLLSSQLPGWGSWGGVGLKTRTSKIVKVDPYQKRKDKIIVNDYSNEKLKKHLVSSLPFPFTSVEAFESSIRNPIGRSFVPETVHNALVLPALITKMGQIIEPMTEEELNNKNEPLKFQKKGTGRKPFITKKIK